VASKRLKFAPEYVAPIIDGQKRSTIRLAPDTTYRPGDFLGCVDADSGETFARAKIDMVTTASARWLADADFEGHRNYRTVGHLLDHLREYYPEADLSPQRELTLVRFEDVRRVEGFDLGLDPREPRPEEVRHVE